MSDVFIISLRVSREENSIMPSNSSGAYVNCYAMSDSYDRAVEVCISSLDQDGMRTEEILEPICSMPASEWSKHIVEQWPNQAAQMPTQVEFESSIRAGKAVYGPFGSY